MFLGKRQLGFSLVEILITLFLVCFLITMTMQLLLSLKQISQYQQGMMRIQENMQVASHLIGRLVRSAGDYGCNRMDNHRRMKVIGNIDIKHLGINRTQSIEPVSIDFLAQNPFFSKYALSRYKEGSDLLWIKRLGPLYSLRDYSQAAEGTIKVKGSPRYNEGSVLFLSDCQSIDVVRVTKTVVGSENHSTIIHVNVDPTVPQLQLSKLYAPLTEVGKFESIILYVGDTLRKNQSGEPIYALFSTDLNGRTLELIEGVEDMAVTVCCQMKEKVMCYQASDWQGDCLIQTVKVYLSFNSVENVLPFPTLYVNQLLKQQFKDKMLHKGWSGEWVVRSAIR